MENRLFIYSRNPRALQEEIVWGGALMRRAYYSKATWLRDRIFKSPLLSQLMGWYFDSRWSTGRIQKFVNQMQINTEEILLPLSSFKCFNDFFIRQLKPASRPFDSAANVLSAAAEGRALFFPSLTEKTSLSIKGKAITIADILPDIHGLFVDGAVAVIRLNPTDYHRFHFPCDCEIADSCQIKGAYYSVNPIAFEVGLNPFKENVRTVTLLQSKAFEYVAMVEVGASGVASIVQTHSDKQAFKMDEKGYFKFGGSTVILFFQKDKVVFDEDLVQNSREGFETFIKVGETIGRAR